MTNVLFKKDEEEATFKRKLLYDGHGLGDDKRLLNLIKNLTKLCFTDESNEDFVKLCNSIQREMVAATSCAQKHVKISEMYDRTFTNVQKAILDKTRELDSIKLEMTNLQLELEFVEKLKKVDVFPKAEATKLAMEDVERRKRKLIQKIEDQKLIIQTMIAACKSLQKVIDEVDSNDTINSRQAESETSPDENSL